MHRSSSPKILEVQHATRPQTNMPRSAHNPIGTGQRRLSRQEPSQCPRQAARNDNSRHPRRSSHARWCTRVAAPSGGATALLALQGPARRRRRLLFAVNCKSRRLAIALRLSLGAAIALLSPKDLAPVMIDQPKPYRTRRPGRAGRFAHRSRDVRSAHRDLRQGCRPLTGSCSKKLNAELSASGVFRDRLAARPAGRVLGLGRGEAIRTSQEGGEDGIGRHPGRDVEADSLARLLRNRQGYAASKDAAYAFRRMAHTPFAPLPRASTRRLIEDAVGDLRGPQNGSRPVEGKKPNPRGRNISRARRP